MPFILASDSLQLFVKAATFTDKESEVESIFSKLESDARAFRDEIERANVARCETNTLEECYQGNFNDCDSTFPNQVCLRPEELVNSTCADGVKCNVLGDKTVSKVSIPRLSSGSIAESVCYSRLAEPFMVDKYKADEEYWDKYDAQTSWSYFGAHDGVFRMIPAFHQEECGLFDPRRRPWFVAASSGPKDVVLVLDVSDSMENNGMDTAKEAAKTVIDTLTIADRFAVISFSSDATQVGGETGLIPATNDNIKQMKEAINKLTPKGGTNFEIAFTKAFDVLDESINEATFRCNIAILFMTDGKITEGKREDDVISLVNNRTEQLLSNYGMKTTIFTFSLGHEADHIVTKTIACSTGGIWTNVSDISGDLISAMSAYYQLFALGLGVEENKDFVAWVEPYAHFFGGAMGTTVSVPVYDRSVTPHLFLGVVGISVFMSAIERVLGEEATSSTMLDRFVRRSTARCPKIELGACELDALRFITGGENATCEFCNSTNYAGVVPSCPSQSDVPNDLWDNSNMAGRKYNERACCEVGQNVPSDSCPARQTPDSSALIIVISVLASIIGVLMMGLLLSHMLKKPNPMVDVPVAAVPVQEGDISIINPSKNANMEQYPGASAPPPPVNPQFLAQEGVRVY